MQYQLITVKQISTKVIATSIFLVDSPNAHKVRLVIVAIVNNTVNETQAENPMTSFMIYSRL